MNKEHEYCLRCGRKLKNPVARISGYGLVCMKKSKKATKSLFNKESNHAELETNDRHTITRTVS